MSAFFGKYRGKVFANVDPMKLGRIQVTCHAVLGQSPSGWAMPCVPYAGPQVGFFAIPPVGARVWVEFEGGDPDYPVWSGCFWGKGEAPNPGSPEIKVWKTENIALSLNDIPAERGFTLEVGPAPPLTLTIDESGINFDDGSGWLAGSDIQAGRRPWDQADEHYVRDCINEILFTNPGEWVNRPDFGCGLKTLVFEPVNEAFISATQALVRRSLRKWAGDLIKVEAVRVSTREGSLKVNLSYMLRSSGKSYTEVFLVER